MELNPPLELAVIRMGSLHPTLEKKYGHFDKWFWNALRAVDPSHDPDCFLPNEVTPADLEALDGLILSGAEENIEDALPWRDRFNQVLQDYLDSGRPVLGVCFGHQYLADFFGGSVAASQTSREFGNVEMELTSEGREDPLFAGIPSPASFLQVHNQMVVEPPPGAVILAANSNVPMQSFRLGENVRGVQFHPEMTPGIVLSAIDLFEKDKSEEELTVQKLETQQPHDGLRLLANFARLCTSGK